MADPTWKPFDPSGLRARLVRVRTLLLQAAAVGLATDAERLDQLAELERAIAKPAISPPRKRR